MGTDKELKKRTRDITKIYMLNNNMLIIVFAEEITIYEAASFAKRIRKAFEVFLPEHIIFDITKLNYVSSAGIGAFLIAVDYTKKNGGKVALVNTEQHNKVKEIFEHMSLDSIIEFHDSIDEAVKSFKSPII